MKFKIIPFVILLFSLYSPVLSQQVLIQNDNGSPRGPSIAQDFWEESVYLKPDGPCQVVELQVYYIGNTPGVDTLYIVGDPVEGALPPTSWVLGYNLIHEPITVEYDGHPGWRKIPISGLRSDGFDRIWFQHIIYPNGPRFAIDDDGVSTPDKSFLMNPFQMNVLQGPGVYHLTDGDLMVRVIVEYDYPDGMTSLAPPSPCLVDVTRDAGIVKQDGTDQVAPIVSVADWTGDGFDDIAIGSDFYMNNGDATFSLVSSDMNIPASGTVWADVDNDGFMDCFAVNGHGQDAIYWGKADGTFEKFTDITVIKDQPTVTPLWFDYNHDGLLDLFVAYRRKTVNGIETYFPNQLFKNLGNRAFLNVTDTAHIAAGEPAPYYDCWGASICDFNNDGWPDIFVATYRLAPDLLYLNNQDGTFTETGAQTDARGVPTSYNLYFGNGMGSDWGDYNNDGYVDLAVGNICHSDWRGDFSNPSLIFKNTGPPDYLFVDKHIELGLKFFEMNAGIVWADLDLDGYQDLFHCQNAYYEKGAGTDRLSRVYINQGPSENFKLKDMTWEFGAVIHGAWCPVRFDYDNDGDMDILVGSDKEKVVLFRNDIEPQGSWLQIKLTGSPSDKVANDAFGSSVSVVVGDKILYRSLPGTVITGRSAQVTNVLHFGLGQTRIVNMITVVFPDGKQHNFENVEPNVKYTIGYNGTIQKSMTANASIPDLFDFTPPEPGPNN